MGIKGKKGGGPAAEPQNPSEPVDARPTAQATRAANARQVSGRRRFVDPTTCEREYTDAEAEFMHAMHAYKISSGRMFPTWSEVLGVLKGLGYEKPAQATPGPPPADALSAPLPPAEVRDRAGSGPPGPATETDLETEALALMTGLPGSRLKDWARDQAVADDRAQLANEMRRLWLALREVIRPEAIPGWLETPNDELGGVTPVEVLRRGESDRIRSLIFFLESGMPL